jgi:hypothetical protein
LPAVVVALLVVGLMLALVLDRLWIDAARVELSVGAEAAALRAAQELAGDHRLRAERDDARIAEHARRAAKEVAARNLVAGQPLILDTTVDGDVRFGRRVRAARGRDVFLETEHLPTTVVVLAERSRSRANPLGLFLRGLTGQATADVAVFAEASIDGRVVGVRPFEGANVPAIPLAVLERDESGQDAATWAKRIEQRTGDDAFGFDESSGMVTSGGDGIPELALRSTGNGSNMCWIDAGNGLQDPLIAEQIDTGLNIEHLSETGGTLRIDKGPLRFRAGGIADGTALNALAGIAGEKRICFLAGPTLDSSSGRACVVDVRRIEAVRVMHVSVSHAHVTVIVQPTVICTRTAVLPQDLDSSPGGESDAAACVYKLHLTR